MSGTKRAVIVPSWRDALIFQCRWAKQWLESAELPPSLAALQSELKEARATAHNLAASKLSSGAPEQIAASLKGAEKVRGELGLLLQRQQTQWAAAEAALNSLRGQLAGGEKLLAGRLGQGVMKNANEDLHAALKQADVSLSAIRLGVVKVNNLRRELQLWNARITKLAAPPANHDPARAAIVRPTATAPADSEEVQREITNQAAEATAREGLKNLSATTTADRNAVAGRLRNAARWEEYAALLKDAEIALASKDWTRAQTAVNAASAQRIALLHEALETAAAMERNQQIADAIMEALCARHYSIPKHGELTAGDPLGGIQIRADVPGTDGKGNVRVDLHFDGQAVFKLENVPQGEESLCREFLSQMGNALSAVGMELRMEKAWAGGTHPPSGDDDEPRAVVEVQTQRERQKEREG